MPFGKDKGMEFTRESEFIGCASTTRFLVEKIELATDRGYGVIVEPVGGENNRAFNIYQVTPSLAKSAPDLYEALESWVEWYGDTEDMHREPPIDRTKQALSKVEEGK